MLESHKEYEWKWIYIYVEAPTLSTNINRRNGQIPSECFERFTRTLDWPNPDEYGMLFISKQQRINCRRFTHKNNEVIC